MNSDDSPKSPPDASGTVQIVADLYEVGIAVYRQRMAREHGSETADARVRVWLDEYTPHAGWRLAMPRWAAQ